MKTLKIAGLVSAALLAAFAVASVVSADTALGVSCSGSVTDNVITWSATSTGGVAPYTYLWSGDSSVAGSASTSIIATYVANGTYNAVIQATDASSTIATSTCSANVTSIGLPAPTSTVNVFVAVNNTAGGSAVPANFTVTASGASSSPSTFSGSGTGTAVMVNAGAAYTIGASSLANYTQSLSGSCASSLSSGAVATCTVTETYVVPTPTPTSTPPLPKVNLPFLSIGGNGAFLARDMTVTSVSSGSFQGQVWGITYTVNWSGNLLQFYFRGGDKSTSTPSIQLAVGDEVGVAGKITSGTPFVVDASVVRDYSIVTARTHPDNHGAYEGNKGGNSNKTDDNDGKGNNGNGNGNGNGGGFQARFGAFFQGLGNFFKGHK